MKVLIGTIVVLTGILVGLVIYTFNLRLELIAIKQELEDCKRHEVDLQTEIRNALSKEIEEKSRLSNQGLKNAEKGGGP